MAAGRFITLEGGEGTGKSTLARALRSMLCARRGRDVVTREPGGAPGADAIRALLVEGDANRVERDRRGVARSRPRALNHLTRHDRARFARGAVVICDRYYDSTRAYQIAARGSG